MKIRVKFIGDDHAFYEKLQERYREIYTSIEFTFFSSSIKTNPSLQDVYREIYRKHIDIIFVDFDEQEEFCNELCRLINANAEMRKRSLCALHNYTGARESIAEAVLSQVRINHIKGLELHNITYDTMTFLDVDLAKTPPFLNGKEFGKTEVLHDIRIGYAYDDCYHIESNTKLPLNSIVEITEHPLDHFCLSKRFLVTNEMSSNLYYNTRFSYDLEFTYMDNVFFRSTEQDWVHYKEFVGRKQEYEQETGFDYDEMEANVRTRKHRVKHLRQEVREWCIEKSNEEIRKVKVMVFDDELEALDEAKKIEEFRIKFETGLIFDYYQIRRFKPHIVIFNVTEKHDIEKLRELLDYLDNYEHTPYLIVTNTSEKFDYENVITFPASLDVETLEQLVDVFKNKKSDESDVSRVFFPSEYPKAAVKVKMDFNIIAFNESVVYFIAEQEIPMWTVFEAKGPIEMLLTVVPDVANSKFASEKNCYRALINGLNELEMAKLRVIINESLEEKEEEDEEQQEGA